MFAAPTLPWDSPKDSDRTTPNTVTFAESLRDALRLAIWCAPRNPDTRMSGLAMAAIFAVVALVSFLADLLAADGAWRTFNPYGLNASIASLAMDAVVILAFSHLDRSQATCRRLVLVFALMAAVGVSESALIHVLTLNSARGALSKPMDIALWVMCVATYVWLIGVARQAFKPARAVRRPTLRAIAFVVVLVAAAVAPPTWPVFMPKNFDYRSANLWEYVKAQVRAKQSTQETADNQAKRRVAEAGAARLEGEQGSLLAAALEKLAPRDPAAANVFTVGVAGFSDQDVFLKEIRQSTAILKSRFHWGERTLTLLNNAATAQEAPMASMANIGAALRAVGARMDREKDLLVLVLSSHGSPDGFALSYDDMVDRTLDPETLRRLLDESGVRNRVVIVSSCYAGAFIAPLQNPDTMILTAAAADRTSFGCADDRRWTWFGEAFFEKALAGDATLAEAFVAAKSTIAGWETAQGLTPSNPQIFLGEAIARKFPDIVGNVRLASQRAAAEPKPDARPLSLGAPHPISRND